MAEISENLSRLEAEAQELVTKLRVLHGQIGSYKEAKETLQRTGEPLERLISAVADLAQESKTIVETFNEVGGAGLVERIGQIGNDLSGLSTALSNMKQELSDRVGDLRPKVVADLSSRIDELGAKVTGEINTLEKKHRRRFWFIFAGVGVIVVLQVLKIFFIDKTSISEFLLSLRGLI